MGFLELLFIAVGLSMDAFAASLCKGLSLDKPSLRNSVIVSLFFGGFQAVMPLIGWLLGKQFESYITKVDHWIAFGLLAFIGGKMIIETFKKDECTGRCEVALNLKELTLMAVATSIDALAVGVTFAFLQVLIVPSVLIIGIITFAISLAGVFIGHSFGVKLKAKAELAGGVVLILIGIKILLNHLGIL
jgi:putative Mn2+ efflux pump MntP